MKGQKVKVEFNVELKEPMSSDHPELVSQTPSFNKEKFLETLSLMETRASMRDQKNNKPSKLKLVKNNSIKVI